MRTTKWLAAVVLPAGLLAMASVASAAGTVDCTKYTVTCNTLLKGGVKFKPIITNSCVGTVTDSIKGSLFDCTVGNQSGPSAICVGGTNAGGACADNGACPGGLCGVQVASGSVKGTLTTGFCDCGHLFSANTISAGSLVTSFKFLTKDASSNPLPSCSATVSTLTPAPGVAKVTPGALLPGPPFNPTAVYGEFSLDNNLTTSGIFQGPTNGGTNPITTGSTVESVGTIVGNCNSLKGLKALTFGATDTVLK